MISFSARNDELNRFEQLNIVRIAIAPFTNQMRVGDAALVEADVDDAID